MTRNTRAAMTAIALATLLAGLAAPVAAQEQPPEPVAILKVDSGEVKVSDGGDFLAGATGQPLVEGNRVMLPVDAQARLVYDDNCVVELKTPGVFVVERECKKLAALPPKPVSGAMIGGIIGGAVLIGVAAGGGGGDDPPPPVSR